MKLLCLQFLRRLRNIVALPFLQSSPNPSCTTLVPITSLGRGGLLARTDSNTPPANSFYRRSSFWTTLLTGLAVVSALIFFLIQWLYQDWTARKDFLEYCQSLQTANSTLSPACQGALGTPLPPPPFSYSIYVRNYLPNKALPPIILFYDKSSNLQKLLVVGLWLICLSLISRFVSYPISFTEPSDPELGGCSTQLGIRDSEQENTLGHT